MKLDGGHAVRSTRTAVTELARNASRCAAAVKNIASEGRGDSEGGRLRAAKEIFEDPRLAAAVREFKELYDTYGKLAIEKLKPLIKKYGPKIVRMAITQVIGLPFLDWAME